MQCNANSNQLFPPSLDDLSIKTVLNNSKKTSVVTEHFEKFYEVYVTKPCAAYIKLKLRLSQPHPPIPNQAWHMEISRYPLNESECRESSRTAVLR